MGVPTLEIGYTSATTGRWDHEAHKGHVVALKETKLDMETGSQVHKIYLNFISPATLQSIKF
jgi:hypothetical protein